MLLCSAEWVHQSYVNYLVSSNVGAAAEVREAEARGEQECKVEDEIVGMMAEVQEESKVEDGDVVEELQN